MVMPTDSFPAEQIILFCDGTIRTFSLIQQFSQQFFHLGKSLPTTLLLTQRNPLSALQEKLLIEYLRITYHDLAVHKINDESRHTLPVTLDFNKCALVIQSPYLPDFITELLSSLKKVSLSMPHPF